MSFCSCIPSKSAITFEEVKLYLRTKKETSRSRLIASYNAACKVPLFNFLLVLVGLMHELCSCIPLSLTLAERKSATFGAKDLSCRETSARIFSHLHALLTHLPLVSSFRRSFSSSASNAFSRQLLSKKLSSLRTKKETSRSRLIASYNAAWQRPTLAERKSDYHRR